MKNFKNFTIIFFFILLSCSDKKHQKVKLSEPTQMIDSLIFVRDTTVFNNSSEGEKLSLFKNKVTGDSIIKSTIYGEMGKVDFAYVFNKQLLKANRLTSNYEEPIYVNKTPKIVNKTEDNLSATYLIKKELINIFLEYAIIFRSNKLHTKLNKTESVLNSWEGIYYLSPYALDSEEVGNYYIEVFKDYSDFGFSGTNEFRIEIEIIEKGNKLYIYDKKKYSNKMKLDDALAVLTKLDNKYYVKSKIITVLRKDIVENNNGYVFNWKKTVEEVPDTPE